MSNAVDDHSPSSQRSPLARWIHQTLGPWRVRVKFRLRGNNLHILCEGASCPERNAALLRLIPALQQTDLNTLIPSHQPRIYQVLLYGRRSERSSPDWTANIHLNQLDRHLAQLQHPHPSPSEMAVSTVPAPPNRPSPQSKPAAPSAIVLSNRSLAKRGQTEAIARYLSESLSKLGVSVKVSVKTIPYLGSSVTLLAPPSSPDANSAHSTSRRLWITCGATYSPDPSLISEAIAHQLRDLELEGYRDAVILIQVAGETKPDWALRVDLTPTKEMLREWARWGDVEAIERLLNLELAPANIQLATISLKDSTLHVVCRRMESSSAATAPDQKTVQTIVTPLLETLGPQGIHAATLYGQVDGEPAPSWVSWLDLPASIHSALADPVKTLAKQRDWEAIAFLLNRLLNPDIDQQLATGGIRLQILPKQDLLHIMADAPLCPDQRRVGPAIAQFLQDLEIPDIAGVRVYGRRAGQKRPLWSYGSDFAARNRLVPEATPEFAATDAYIGDLIAPPDEDIIRPDLTPADLQTAWTTVQQNLVHHVQRILVRSQLFTIGSDVQDRSVSASGQAGYQTGKAVAIWGAVGLLLMIQADWILGQMLQRRATSSSSAVAATGASPSPSVAADEPEVDLSFPDIALNDSIPNDSAIFNSSGFTQSGQTREPSTELGVGSGTTSSPKSASEQTDFTPVSQIPEPTTPIATVTAADSPYPTFNSRQLDEKIALYYEFLEQSGPPDVMVIGSSRALRGVDPAALKRALSGIGYKDVTVFNFGVNGATAQVVDLILRELLTPDQLPRLVVWADGARAFNSGGVDVTYNGIAASEGYQQIADGTIPLYSVPQAAPVGGTADLPGASASGGIGSSLASGYRSIDTWLSDRLAAVSTAYQERDRLKTLLQQTVSALFPDSDNQSANAGVVATDENTSSLPQEGQGLIDFEGFLPLSVQFNPATYYQQYARVAGEYDSDYKDFQIEGRQAEALRSLLDLAQSHNIPIVFVNLPLTQQYLDTARSQHEQEFKQYMLNLAVQHPGFIFRDLGELWLDQYDYFSDPSHLNRYGAYEISNRLAQDPMVPWSDATSQKQ